MTPEERAKAITKPFEFTGAYQDDIQLAGGSAYELRDAIATAIREAEARGMERALSAAMAAVDDEPLSCRKRVAAAIRAEKERTP